MFCCLIKVSVYQEPVTTGVADRMTDSSNNHNQNQPQFIILPREQRFPTFRGNGYDSTPAEEWVDEVLRVTTSRNWPDAEGAEYVLSHLEGIARREILSLPVDDRNSAAKICAAVKTAFGEQRTAAVLREAIYGRSQGKSESVRDYAHALLQLKGRLDEKTGDASSSMTNTAFNERFIEGLRPGPLRKHMRRHLAANSGTSFLSLRNAAMQWEREEEEDTVSTAATSELSTSNSIQSQIAALTDTVAQLTTAVAELRQQPRRPFRRPPRCFGCKREGHFLRNCPDQHRPTSENAHASL